VSRLNYRSWPLSLKISVVFSALLVGILFLTGYNSYRVYQSSMQKQIEEYVPQVLTQINKHLETYFDEVNAVSKLLLAPSYNDPLAAVLGSIERDAAPGDLAATIRLHDSIDYLKLSGNIRGISVYTNDRRVYVREDAGGLWKRFDPQAEPWYAGYDPKTGTSMILGVEQEPNLEGKPYVFSIVQPIGAPNREEGLLKLSSSLQPIDDIMRDVDFGKGSRLYVLDHHNKFLYASDPDLIGRPWNGEADVDPDAIGSASGSKIVAGADGDELVSYTRSTDNGWKVIAVIPLANLSQGVNRVKEWTFFWMVAGIALAAILATLISYTITKPIRSLIGQIRQLESNNFAVEIKRFQTDEVGHLTLVFQRMARRLNVLVNEVLQAQILRQEAEIGALQSRINPHFMNNVLENFRMMLKRGRAEQVEAGLVSMGQLLRYHASRAQETVPLQAELDFLSHYMHIQKLRFGERLHFRAEIDEEARPCLIPSLLLQPLVENAINHGESPDGEEIRIELRVRKEPGRLVLSIADEGNGIEEERLEAIMDAIENGRKVDGRIGLTNVYQRLKLTYRGRGSMSIQSEVGLGTRVALTIPLDDR